MALLVLDPNIVKTDVVEASVVRCRFGPQLLLEWLQKPGQVFLGMLSLAWRELLCGLLACIGVACTANEEHLVRGALASKLRCLLHLDHLVRDRLNG